MKEAVRYVLEAATRAPSGENSQPWRFRAAIGASHSTIDVSIKDAYQESLYGWGERASYVAVGAAIQNICTAATEVGLRATTKLFPNPENQRHVAHITLTPAKNIAPDPFAGFISKRVTNRKPYKKQPLEKQARALLEQTAHETGSASLFLTTDEDEIRKLAQIGSNNERILLNNPIAHKFFFKHINWTPEQDAERKVGFFIDTLELPPPARVGFKVLREWRRARFLNSILHFNDIVAAQNANLYSTASAIGVVVSPQESEYDALQAGMHLQRLWLAATSQGLSLQPMAGTLYFLLRLRAGDTKHFSDEEQSILWQSKEQLEHILRCDDRAVSYFMFRIGYADPPSAQALRFGVEEVTDFESP